jgi:hypothetical protein
MSNQFAMTRNCRGWPIEFPVNASFRSVNCGYTKIDGVDVNGMLRFDLTQKGRQLISQMGGLGN